MNARFGLFFSSFLFLFFELVLIRWLPSQILSLAYYANFVLISCFLGFGLGCLLAKKQSLFKYYPVFLAVILGLFICFHWFEVIVSTDNEWVWSGYTGNQLVSRKFKIGLIPVISIVFILNSVLFLPLGQYIGSLMEKFKPIEAYSINVFGSVIGIAAFTFLSLFGSNASHPVIWFSIISIIVLWLIHNERKWLYLGVVLCVIVCALIAWRSQGEIWSPYYNIQHSPSSLNSRNIYVNKFFHQRIVDFSKEEISKSKYGIPYKIAQARDVLILGAGSGNDATIALLNGAERIDAVEIDPEIVKLGREYNPQQPYADNKVNVIVDDARTYLRQSTKKYDLVVFGTLDSHALLSGQSSVRLDNFVYTLEAMQDVKNVLNPNGVVALLFSIPKTWIGEKLLAMVYQVFPQPSPLIYWGDNHLFNLMIIAGPGISQQMRNRAVNDYGLVSFSGVTKKKDVPSDDWPYLYLLDRGIPGHYLQVIALLFLLSLVTIGFLIKESKAKFSVNFFALGAAFMLLETKSVISLSLLFGSTWLVNAFVFGAILVMVLFANWLVSKISYKTSFTKPSLIYLGLALSLGLNYITPLKVFLGHGWLVQNVFSAVFIALPIFFSSLLFAYFFKTAQNISAVFAANLLGTVLGGFLEYSSMLIGLNNLYIVAGIFYLLSFLKKDITEFA